MTVGDVLEWLAGSAFVAAAYRFAGLALALLIVGVVLAYEAQCYDHSIPAPHPIRWLNAKRASKKAAKASQ